MIEESTEVRLARLERAVARSLGLLEQGRTREARLELAQALAPSPAPAFAAPLEFSDGVSDQEFERAFEAAEPETDQMLDADRVAQVSMRQADEALRGEFARGEVSSAFATETMADLLERQGDATGASRIRAGLAAADRPAAPRPALGRPDRQQVIAALERWLENLRGGARA